VSSTHARSTTHNVLYALAAQVGGKLGTLIWTLVAARTLTTGELGSFTFALSLAMLVSSGAEWAFDAVLVRRASRHPEQLEQRFAEAVAWQAGLALPLFVLTGLVTWLLRPDTPLLPLVLLLAAVYLDLWSNTARSAASAARNQAVTAGALVVQRLATAAFAVPVLLLGGSTGSLALAFLAAYAVGAVAHAIALRRIDVHFRPRLLTRTGLRQLARGTGAMGLSALVLMALFRLDAVLLAAISGDEALGAYSTAYRLFETALFLVFAVAGAVYPVMSARPDDADVVRGGIESGMGVLATAYVPFAAICLVEAEPVLSLLFGRQYGVEAAGALRWLGLAPLAYAAAYLASSALAATGRTRGLLTGAVVALLVNVALNLALLPRYAGTAAGFATTASYAVEAVWLLAAVAQVTGRVRLLRPLAAPGVAGMLLAGFLLVSPLPLVLDLALGLLLYAAAWLVLVRHTEPVQVLRIRRLLGGRGGSTA
jgi:O-antigen/teichoic acid export membrane protein